MISSMTAIGALRYTGTRVPRVEDARLLTGARHLRRRHRPAPGCCTPASCAARSPAAAIGGIDPSAALGSPGVHAVFAAADLNPDVREQWYTMMGQNMPTTPAAAAGRGRGPLRRRPGRARRRRQPVRRRGRGRAGRRRLRAAAAGRRLPHRGRSPTTLVHAELPRQRRRHARRSGRADRGRVRGGRPRRERDDLPAGVRRGADGDPRHRRGVVGGERRAHDLGRDPGAARGARRTARACSASPSTGSG